MATALITGATGGLGAAVTERFLADGWDVVAPWLAERERARVTAHERLTLVQADLFDAGQVADVVARAGPELRAVVNLVGGFAAGGRVHETPLDSFEEQLRLNLRATYLVCQAALARLLEGGGGSIVCVGSRAAMSPFAGAAGYVVSKAAVLSFVEALAVEYRHDGIRANAVLPSVIDTPANRASMPDADHAKWVPPAEIAAVIAFLCSDAAAAVSGARVPVYGRA